MPQDKYGINSIVKESVAQTPIVLSTELVFIGSNCNNNETYKPKQINSVDEFKSTYTIESTSLGNTDLELAVQYAFNVVNLDHVWTISCGDTENPNTESVNSAIDDIYRLYGVIPSIIVTQLKDGLASIVAHSLNIADYFKAQVFAYQDCKSSLTDVRRGDEKIGVLINTESLSKNSSDGSVLSCIGNIKTDGKLYPMSIVCACLRAVQDSKNISSLPNRSVGNLRIVSAEDYVIIDENDKEQSIIMPKSLCDALAASGYILAINKGGHKWYTWGDHTAAVNGDGEVDDELYRFDSNVAMIYYIANRFIAKWESVIDNPMTLALRNDIINEEQNYLDYLVSIGCLVGSPTAEFSQLDNTNDTLGRGQFYFRNVMTTTMPAKYIELGVQYTSDGLSAYLV